MGERVTASIYPALVCVLCFYVQYVCVCVLCVCVCVLKREGSVASPNHLDSVHRPLFEVLMGAGGGSTEPRLL